MDEILEVLYEWGGSFIRTYAWGVCVCKKYACVQGGGGVKFCLIFAYVLNGRPLTIIYAQNLDFRNYTLSYDIAFAVLRL